jgi:hypothetical protein
MSIDIKDFNKYKKEINLRATNSLRTDFNKKSRRNR